MAVPKHITQISGLKADLMAGMEEWQFGFMTDNALSAYSTVTDQANAPCHSTSGVDEILVCAMCKTVDPSTGAEEYLDIEFGNIIATVDDDQATGISYPLKLHHTTTGSSGTGMGTGIKFRTEFAAPYNILDIGYIYFEKQGTANLHDSGFYVKTAIGGNFASRIRVDYQGYFGIGSAIAAGFDSIFHICPYSAGTVSCASGTLATIENNNDAFLSFLTPNNKQSGIIFGDPDDEDVASIKYNHSTNCFTITGKTIAPTLPSGATQVAAGAAANELWVTSGHATLADNIVMRGV